jgi:hypothetical protein
MLMISRFLILAGMLQIAVGLSAQIAGITDSGASTRAADQSQAEREWRDTIENVSRQDIVALHVTFLCTEGNGRVHRDDNGSMDKLLQYETDRLIPPRGNYVATVFEKGECKSKADAVVYVNGEVEGDPAMIDLIFQRRTGADMALSIVIPLLNQIASGKASSTEITNLLRERIQELSNGRAFTPPLSPGEITGESFVFGETINLLQVHAWLRTPSDSTPNRQPRIQEVMQKKNMSLEQAHAYVTSNKFHEWQSELAQRLSPQGEN